MIRLRRAPEAGSGEEQVTATARGDTSVPAGDHGSAAARAIVTVLIEGFDRHYRRFRSTSAQAKERFDAAAWGDAQ